MCPATRGNATRALNTRGAGRRIYVVREACGLAKEIGDWSEGTTAGGSWVATTDENLMTAIRFSLAMEQVDRAKAARRTVDLGAIEAQAGRIRDALKRVANLQRMATTIRTSSDGITSEANDLRADVLDALRMMEEAIGAGGSSSEAA